MSNLKRSTPDLQDALLHRLQKMSTSRMETERVDHNSLSKSQHNANPDLRDLLCRESQEPHSKNRDSPPLTPKTENSTNRMTDCALPHNSAIPLDKANIPYLKITSKETNNFKTLKTVLPSPNSLSKMTAVLSKGDLGDRKPVPFLSTGSLLSPQPSPPPQVISPLSSPKLCSRFENCPENSPSPSSPMSPSRKYFKIPGSSTLFAGSLRRGSEPLLDGKTYRDLNEAKIVIADKRWEKLRSILVALKDEPFDVNSIIKSPPPKTQSSLENDVNVPSELCDLKKELSSLRNEMKLKDSKLQQALNERNTALAFIRQCKLDGTGSCDENKNEMDQKDLNENKDFNENLAEEKDSIKGTDKSIYANQLESLKGDKCTKEDAMNVLTKVLEELMVERSYLNHLMAVVLESAPWMLDEVDKGGHWVELTPDNSVTNSSDDEVWC